MIIVDISKKIGARELTVSFEMDSTQMWAIFGDSGIGKTTLLKMVAGLINPDSGVIEVDGKEWFNSSKGINLSVNKRGVGFVFQDYALFENMTLIQNILYAQKISDKERAKDLLEHVELDRLSDKKPSSLSGGQKQRLALIRAIAQEPNILLLDEPLSALDNQTRKRLQNEIYKIQKEFNIPSLIVSHDKSEVLKLASRVVWIQNNKTINISPTDLFNISSKNILQVEVISIDDKKIYLTIGDNLIYIDKDNLEYIPSIGKIVKVEFIDGKYTIIS